MDYAEVLTSIRRIVRSVHLESKRIEKEFGVSIPQILTLNFLHRQTDYKASQRQIGEFLSLNASTVTGIINRLEKKSLVAKLPKGADRRISYITITAKGASLIQDSPELMHDRLEKKLKSLSDGRLQQLRGAFQLIIEFLELDTFDASPILTSNIDLKADD